VLIPLRSLPERFAEIPRDRDVVLHCHHGVRSLTALQFLRAQGYERVTSLAGGIEAWSLEIDPSVPRY
jgi:rhodanese-related sulfurtransferase